MLVLEPERDIAYVEVIEIAAYAFRNAAYVRRRKDEGLVGIT